METKWLAFSYTLSAKKKSSTRVALWRRLRQLGAVSPTSGIYILPAISDCIESFQWLAQEVKEVGGQAIVMYVDEFDNMGEATIIELFQEARKEAYSEINAQVAKLEKKLESDSAAEAKMQVKDGLIKLKHKYAQSVAIDYFKRYESESTAANLEKLSRLLFPDANRQPDITPVQIEAYRGKQWITRPQPHVDRLACIWLIRRFIDEAASIRYGLVVQPNEIAFDMNEAQFGHTGNLCTFETMSRAFQIEVEGMQMLAEIVHEIDLRDERFMHPEAIGIEAILRGWLVENLTDAELERRGLALFDGLFQTLSVRG